MAIALEVYKEARIVTVRFERGMTGEPDSEYPDIDDRGHSTAVPAVNGLASSGVVRGPVVGLMQDQQVKLRLVRERIDNSATLFLTSDDDSVVTVESPAAGAALQSAQRVIIELKGKTFSGSQPKRAKVQVRFSALTGPILHELTVYVFPTLTINVVPHLVTIHDSGGSGGSAPSVNVSDVMDQVKAIWACCGVSFNVGATQRWSVNLSSANLVRGLGTTVADVNGVIAGNWQANATNVYFVKRIDGACGYGFSKSAHAGFGVSQPSVFLGEVCDASDPRTTYWWANDLAHEFGHFFSLWHPTDNPTPTREDLWCMRFLMHNFNRTWRDPSPAPTDYVGFNNFGYGDRFRAAMIPFKQARSGAGAGRDAQCSTARNFIAAGSLY